MASADSVDDRAGRGESYRIFLFRTIQAADRACLTSNFTVGSDSVTRSRTYCHGQCPRALCGERHQERHGHSCIDIQTFEALCNTPHLDTMDPADIPLPAFLDPLLDYLSSRLPPHCSRFFSACCLMLWHSSLLSEFNLHCSIN